jgi:hypothetical protein
MVTHESKQVRSTDSSKLDSTNVFCQIQQLDLETDTFMSKVRPIEDKVHHVLRQRSKVHIENLMGQGV